MALQHLKYLVQDGIPQLTAKHLQYLRAAHLKGNLPQVLDDMAYLFQVNRAALWNGLVIASKGATSQSVRNAAQGAIGFIGMLEAGVGEIRAPERGPREIRAAEVCITQHRGVCPQSGKVVVGSTDAAEFAARPIADA